MKAFILWFIYHRSYNKPNTFKSCWCQWCHAGYLKGWWTYEEYIKYSNGEFK